MNRKEIIIRNLSKLNPEMLNVVDKSATHAGHTGNPDGTDGTHFDIEISSKKLDNLSRVEQHRAVNKLLEKEFDQGLHALSIKIIKTQ